MDAFDVPAPKTTMTVEAPQKSASGLTWLRWKLALQAGWKRAKLWFTMDPGREAQQQQELLHAEHLAQLGTQRKAGAAKIGQLAGYWVDTWKFAEVSQQLQQLFQHMPSTSPSHVRTVVESELQQSLQKLFAQWEEVPFAAASLGQVHRARGWDGTAYAVKVQYPGMMQILQADLLQGDTLERLFGGTLGADVSPEARHALAEAILQELDYQQEAQWMKRFASALGTDAQWLVPRCEEALSSQHVLTATFLPGTPLLQYLQAETQATARDRITRLLFVYGWGTPLLHGLVNADPNPGNFLVVDDAQRLGLVDFGCCTQLNEPDLQQERALWHAVLAGNGEQFRYTLHHMGVIPNTAAFDADAYRLWERTLVEPFQHDSFQYTPSYARQLLQCTQQIVQTRQVVWSPQLSLLWRQRLGLVSLLGTCQGTGPFRRYLWQMLDTLGLAPRQDAVGRPLHFP